MGERRTNLFLLGGLTIITLVLRLTAGMGGSWPVNDGGLFSVMAADLRANGWFVPAFTSYNGGAIPFAYPPLGIYVLALIGVGPGAAWPAMAAASSLLSAATVPAFYLLGRELIGPRSGLIAAAAFAVMPSSEIWLVAGGGVPRSLGLLFALLSLWMLQRELNRSNSRVHSAIAAGGFAGLAFSAHPQAGILAATGLVFMTLAQRRQLGIRAICAGVLALLVASALWWGPVLVHHGVDPFLSAAASRSTPALSFATVLFADVTGASLPVFTGVAVIGLLIQVARRSWFLPGWLVAELLFIPTPPAALGDASAVAVIFSLFIGVAATTALLPPFICLGPWGRNVALVGLSVAALISNLGTSFAGPAPLAALSPDQRAAIQHVGDTVPAGAHVAVVSGQAWPVDMVSEWFPALAGRVSVATVQGSEWIPGWTTRTARAVALQVCADRDTDCLRGWAHETGLKVDYVFLPRGRLLSGPGADDCCSSLRASLTESSVTTFDLPGGTLFSVAF